MTIPIIRINNVDSGKDDIVYVPTDTLQDDRLTIIDKGVFGVFCSAARDHPTLSQQQLLKFINEGRPNKGVSADQLTLSRGSVKNFV